MGYRRLIKQYMLHVHQRTGATWVAEKSCTNLSDRDLNELRSIWSEIERGATTDTRDDLNQRALTLREQHRLTIAELAEQLGWQRRIIEEWFLPTQHPRYRQMSWRDFQHFESSIRPILPGLNDPK